MKTIIFLSFLTLGAHTDFVIVKDNLKLHNVHRSLDYNMGDEDSISCECAKALLNESIHHTRDGFNVAWNACPISLRRYNESN